MNDYPRKIYGSNLSKRRYNPSQCAKEVWNGPRGMTSSQCSRRPGHGDRGLFCKQHAKSYPASEGLSESE